MDEDRQATESKAGSGNGDSQKKKTFALQSLLGASLVSSKGYMKSVSHRLGYHSWVTCVFPHLWTFTVLLFIWSLQSVRVH